MSCWYNGWAGTACVDILYIVLYRGVLSRNRDAICRKGLEKFLAGARGVYYEFGKGRTIKFNIEANIIL